MFSSKNLNESLIEKQSEKKSCSIKSIEEIILSQNLKIQRIDSLVSPSEFMTQS